MSHMMRVRMGTVVELLQYLRGNGRWWLIPVVLAFLLLGFVLLLVHVSSVTPFAYPL